MSPGAGPAMTLAMAIVTEERVEITGPAGAIHALVARPRGARPDGPVVVAWSDIFQLTPPHLRLVRRLASHGYTVVAPELYGRIEPANLPLDFERDRQRALDDSDRMELDWLDQDRRAVLDHARTLGDPDRLGVWGFCFGGHVAMRAALEPAVRATACFYATGVHNGRLGAARGTADTLARLGEIKGRLLLVWGAADPHIPADGRRVIHHALEDAGVRYEFRLFDAEHTFARDEGARYDAAAADQAFAAALSLFSEL
ncbi:MAG: dienelactone hydrolase family protein [Myxococcales bacterium]|nr:MAG: dienelactone hydrolase family protein [Myxococcales bacterium]